MTIFKKLANSRPFLKIALEGFAGSGKTFTAVQIAIGLHKFIRSTKPIACYDTERAFKALKPLFEKEKIEIFTVESRTLADLKISMLECENGFSDILIIDSISHVWEGFLNAFKQDKRRSFLQFQDWGILKPKWKAEFSDKLVMSNLHIIFTGRAGYEYDNEIDEETKKRELVKCGIKMKVEGETEYEPDIVVLMDKVKQMSGNNLKKVVRSGTIIKDRTDTIDGQEFINPKFDTFLPAIQILLDGVASKEQIKETPDTFKTMEEEHYKKKTQRDIYLEEIQGIITQLFPGQTAAEKKLKVDILENVFNTRSWRQIEISSTEQLKLGLDRMKIIKPQIDEYLKGCTKEGIPFDVNQILDIFINVTLINNK